MRQRVRVVSRSAVLLGLFSVLAGCGSCENHAENVTPNIAVGDAGGDATSGDDATVDDGGTTASCPVQPFAGTIGEWTVSVDAEGRWSVAHAAPDGPAITGLPSCGEADAPLRLAVGEPQVRQAFGNFDIVVSAMEWREVRGGVVAESDDAGITLRWPDSDTALLFSASDHGAISIALEPPSDATGGEIGWECGPDESFFGLGTQVTGMDLRGRTYPMWVQEQGNGKNETGGGFPITNTLEAAYAPMGVLHSSSGWAALLGHDAYSEFDLCNAEDPVAPDESVRLRSYPLQPSFVLVPGTTPRERLTKVTDFTGRLPTRPPEWVFGFWVNAVEGPTRIADVASTMRTEGVPVSAIWSEDWAGSAPTATGFRLTYEWSWDPETYPALPDTIDDLNGRGFALLGYFNPFVPETVSHYDEGVAEGYLIEDANGEVIRFPDPAFRQASLIDLTDPDAVDWLQGFQRTAIEDIGLSGWMADFAEWWPLDAVPEGPSSAWAYHNRYPLDWQRANRESFESTNVVDWVYFARSGWASVNGGTSGIAPTMWGGDQDTDWAYDDGFPTIAPIGAHVGLAGVAIFGSDIAGYNSLAAPNTTKELYFRWLAAGAFHPLMRTHHGGDSCENWTFDQDEETIAHTRRYSSIHTLLFPYFSGRLDEAMSSGWPITRHPYLVAPEAAWMWADPDYEWFVGDDILVAPVFAEGGTTRPVSLPGEGWWPLFGDAPVAAVAGDGWETTVDAPVSEIPIFVRPGTGLVLLGEVVDTHFGSLLEQVSDLDDVRDSFRVALYPDADGAAAAGEAGVQLSASGLGAFSWDDATVDGSALPACTADPATSCREVDGVRLVGVESTVVELGGATISVDADRPIDLFVAIGGKAWGELAVPPASVDLDAMPPNWCERIGIE